MPKKQSLGSWCWRDICRLDALSVPQQPARRAGLGVTLPCVADGLTWFHAHDARAAAGSQRLVGTDHHAWESLTPCRAWGAADLGGLPRCHRGRFRQTRRRHSRHMTLGDDQRSFSSAMAWHISSDSLREVCVSTHCGEISTGHPRLHDTKIPLTSNDFVSRLLQACWPFGHRWPDSRCFGLLSWPNSLFW